ncbi:hypothetical protein GLOTRDRAFT_92759 [Gloeophyllum trabeum ATCC 11539]|uniref:Uncharacterized protein n=1 Tax=Gloeophyllum trabeum (strain ATCC 11539 / FP-39264 / Madison 617) TaxID=670483 RepID=S7Q8D0_GLOTA|nr:uncharacterized protein GLOTRDRAFT_92759 [Gloeophyllum trabeum ATCC 11539]EPQ56241.1 hypothetical protein GLOTRDRAFT_92759 [Gloeophyllum trabeum ATCC 11539]
MNRISDAWSRVQEAFTPLDRVDPDSAESTAPLLPERPETPYQMGTPGDTCKPTLVTRRQQSPSSPPLPDLNLRLTFEPGERYSGFYRLKFRYDCSPGKPGYREGEMTVWRGRGHHPLDAFCDWAKQNRFLPGRVKNLYLEDVPTTPWATIPDSVRETFRHVRQLYLDNLSIWGFLPYLCKEDENGGYSMPYLNFLEIRGVNFLVHQDKDELLVMLRMLMTCSRKFTNIHLSFKECYGLDTGFESKLKFGTPVVWLHCHMKERPKGPSILVDGYGRASDEKYHSRWHPKWSYFASWLGATYPHDSQSPNGIKEGSPGEIRANCVGKDVIWEDRTAVSGKTYMHLQFGGTRASFEYMGAKDGPVPLRALSGNIMDTSLTHEGGVVDIRYCSTSPICAPSTKPPSPATEGFIIIHGDWDPPRVEARVPETFAGETYDIFASKKLNGVNLTGFKVLVLDDRATWGSVPRLCADEVYQMHRLMPDLVTLILEDVSFEGDEGDFEAKLRVLGELQQRSGPRGNLSEVQLVGHRGVLTGEKKKRSRDALKCVRLTIEPDIPDRRKGSLLIQ